MHLHHVGCAVRNLEASLENYRALLDSPRCSPIYDVASQRVRVCFVELEPGRYLELIEGVGERSPVDRFVQNGYYHLCFLVEDLEQTLANLGGRHRALPAFASEAFDGNRCQFVMTSEGHLIELAEMSVEAFHSYSDSWQTN